MKPIALALLSALAVGADSIPPPVLPTDSITHVESPSASSQDYRTITSTAECDALNRVSRWECYRVVKEGRSYSTAVPKQEQRQSWDTVTTISISSTGDTVKTLTIKKAEDWEGMKKDIHRATNLYMVLGGLQLAALVILLFVAAAN